MTLRVPTGTLAALVIGGALLAGCGGGSPARTHQSSIGTRPTTTPTRPATTATRPTTTAPARPVRVTLTCQDHSPIVGRSWRYTVTVTDAQGHKLSGTETTNYAFNGTVVGTEKPDDMHFTGGVYHDTIEFPAAAVGYPLELQVVVHTNRGTATARWPLTVKRR